MSAYRATVQGTGGRRSPGGDAEVLWLLVKAGSSSRSEAASSRLVGARWEAGVPEEAAGSAKGGSVLEAGGRSQRG